MSSDSLLLVPDKGLENTIQSDLVKSLEHLGNHKKKKEIDSLPMEFCNTKAQDLQSVFENADVNAELSTKDVQSKPGCCSPRPKAEDNSEETDIEKAQDTDGLVKIKEVIRGTESKSEERTNIIPEAESHEIICEKSEDTIHDGVIPASNEEEVEDKSSEIEEKSDEITVPNSGEVFDANSEIVIHNDPKVDDNESEAEEKSDKTIQSIDMVDAFDDQGKISETDAKSDEHTQKEVKLLTVEENIYKNEDKFVNQTGKDDSVLAVDIKIDMPSSESGNIIKNNCFLTGVESKVENLDVDPEKIKSLNSESGIQFEKIAKNEAVISGVDFKIQHEENENTVKIGKDILEDRSSGCDEMLQMTFCFPQPSKVIFKSKVEGSVSFEEQISFETPCSEPAINESNKEDNQVEITKSPDLIDDVKTSEPEIKCVSENFECDSSSVSQTMDCAGESPESECCISEISIASLSKDEPHIEYLAFNTESPTTECSISNPTAQLQEVSKAIETSCHIKCVEDKDFQSENRLTCDLPESGSVSGSSFEEKDVNHKVAERKCGVDEIIRHLDETQPTHKLRSLCKRGDLEGLKEFLKMKVDLNSVSDEGWTCLHEIITHECQFTNVANLLLLHGADASTQDAHGDSPLHSSLLYHCVTNTELLLKYGANVELANNSGSRPIHMANDVESLKLLLDFGADVNAVDKLGNTCLHYAVVSKDIERVKLLLKSSKYKPNVSIQNRSGATPLHLTSDPEIASLLLDSNANPNLVDLRGNSPLHLAVRGRHKELVWNLLEHKADSSIVNWDGKIPASLAKDKVMKSILAGKSKPEIPTTTGGTTLASRKRPHSPATPVASSPTPQSEKLTPSILKRQRRISREGDEKTSRLRFSDVNDYNYVDEGPSSLERRVKARPIYSEPRFSSDDDE